jgi:hypothetical protein
MKQVILSIILLSSLSFYGQAGKAKTKNLIDSLYNIGDFKTYLEQKRTSEILVKNFKSEKHSDDQVKKTKYKYAELQAKSDVFLDVLEQDLANKPKRKIIIKQPDAYIKKKETDFNKISDFYNNDFLAVYKDVSKSSGGGIGIDAIPFKDILDFVLKLLKDTVVDVAFIKETFTNAIRYKSWDDIK